MNSIASFNVGDIIKVYQKIKEGKRERSIFFKGKVIDIKGSDMDKMFTVRQEIEGINVERIYPFYSPSIEKIDLAEKPKKRVRKANLQHKK